MSLWGETAQLTVELPDKSKEVYFLKAGAPTHKNLQRALLTLATWRRNHRPSSSVTRAGQ